ncbi:hypothetical protein BX600DRAFT_541475 [Xylariales sp. PMI_506]|nr:hypothetical protein BX600DRAFT_541475 [Xylariales sp. PMI_506]
MACRFNLAGLCVPGGWFAFAAAAIRSVVASQRRFFSLHPSHMRDEPIIETIWKCGCSTGSNAGKPPVSVHNAVSQDRQPARRSTMPTQKTPAASGGLHRQDRWASLNLGSPCSTIGRLSSAASTLPQREPHARKLPW